MHPAAPATSTGINPVFFLIMRRMRMPLLALITIYAIATFGLVLVPGPLDESGREIELGIFHAFYIISYTATTIGFGEIPYAFSDAQRLWMIFCIFATVIVWLASIGALITLLQDPSLREAIVQNRFRRRVGAQRGPFFLVCGFGETGGTLVRDLTERGRNAVVVEIDRQRAGMIHMENLRQYVPTIAADAGKPHSLLMAGLKSPLCQGVVALTNSNETNLRIAIAAKLLHREIPVICRADSRDVEANMDSFGTDHIIDPFETFGLHLATAMQAPGLYLLQQWLAGVRGEPLRDPVYPPPEGRWVLCGYGRFGKAVYERLSDERIETVVVEASPERTGTPPAGFIRGRGTETGTLIQAGIERAAGLVAGTDDDANNLSIVMTARALNPGIFVVLRQNLLENQATVDAIGADMVMHPSTIIAHKIRVLLVTPMLSDFLGLALFKDDEWACEVVSRIAAVVDDAAPELWEVRLDPQDASAVNRALCDNDTVRMQHLLCDPRERTIPLRCVPLLILRGSTRILMPQPDQTLQPNDRLLFCGHRSARNAMDWTLLNEYALNYVLTGRSLPQGWAWRTLSRRTPP